MKLSLDEFARVLPFWYEKYKKSPYFEGYRNLLEHLPQKVALCGYLDIEDLCAIADWGGNQHGIKQRLLRHNSASDVQAKTGEAFRYLDKPKWAIGAVLDLQQWGLTYGSKTLMFMNPEEYGALDEWRMRPCLSKVLSRIRNGDRASMVRGYVAFLDICRELQSVMEEPSPESKSAWRISDIQSAIFQFASDEGVMLPNERGSA